MRLDWFPLTGNIPYNQFPVSCSKLSLQTLKKIVYLTLFEQLPGKTKSFVVPRLCFYCIIENDKDKSNWALFGMTVIDF